jgi:hypothetical protein
MSFSMAEDDAAIGANELKQGTTFGRAKNWLPRVKLQKCATVSFKQIRKDI